MSKPDPPDLTVSIRPKSVRGRTHRRGVGGGSNPIIASKASRVRDFSPELSVDYSMRLRHMEKTLDAMSWEELSKIYIEMDPDTDERLKAVVQRAYEKRRMDF